jgi:transposase
MARSKSRASRDPEVGRLVSTVRKRRWTSADARAVLAAYERSGLTLAAFARRHGLSPHRLYEWHRRGDARIAPRFFPVKLVGPAIGPSVEVPNGILEIVIAGDRRVRVHGAVDTAILAQVIEVLERTAC